MIRQNGTLKDNTLEKVSICARAVLFTSTVWMHRTTLNGWFSNLWYATVTILWQKIVPWNTGLQQGYGNYRRIVSVSYQTSSVLSGSSSTVSCSGVKLYLVFSHVRYQLTGHVVLLHNHLWTQRNVHVVVLPVRLQAACSVFTNSQYRLQLLC